MKRAARVALWWWLGPLLDVAGASYYVGDRNHAAKGERPERDPVVIKARFGRMYYQRNEGGHAGHFDLSVPELDRGTEKEAVWWYRSYEHAERVADGFNRSLGAQRRMLLLIAGVATAIGARWAFGCLF